MSGRAAAAAVGATAVASAAVGVALPLVDGEQALTAEIALDALTATSFGIAGALLAWARPRNAIGWLLLLVGVCEGLADAAVSAALVAGDGPWRTWSAWVGSWVWFPALGVLPTAMVALYPTGRAGSRARRALVATSLSAMTAVMLGFALVDDAIDDVVAGVDNPVAVHPLGMAFVVVGGPLLLACALLTLVDAGRRLWLSASPEREQLAWLLTTVVLAVVVSAWPWHTVRAAVYLVVPVAIAVGVARHRLLDLQVVVRRTLLFVGLTAAVVAAFVVSTTLLSGLVGDGPLPVAVAAGLVAVGLSPARELLQRGVDRLVYGQRRDPVRAVVSLGRDVAGTAGVPQVLGTVAAALRSPHVQLLDVDGAPVAEAGEASAGEPLRVPLQVGGGSVGCLVVAPRTPRDGWSSADRDLLGLLAPQVAVAVHAARLNAELLASRDRVVEATAQERARLRQELHDGLGPALSGIALGLEAAEAAQDPARVRALLVRLRQETQTAGREVRRLVDGLRPAALDGRALDEALASFLDGVASGGGLQVEAALQRPLPPLPPDVDAAAYRIVTESVTNVVRHSGARTCRVELTTDDAGLHVVVDDDGHGLPAQPRDGVGLASMRRRAAELGGSWQVCDRPGGGTRVVVTLPVRPGVPA